MDAGEFGIHRPIGYHRQADHPHHVGAVDHHLGRLIGGPHGKARRLEGGTADIGSGQLPIHPPLLWQKGWADHRIAGLVLCWQPLPESCQPAAHIGLLLVDGEQHGSIAQHPGARLAHIDP